MIYSERTVAVCMGYAMLSVWVLPMWLLFRMLPNDESFFGYIGVALALVLTMSSMVIMNDIQTDLAEAKMDLEWYRTTLSQIKDKPETLT